MLWRRRPCDSELLQQDGKADRDGHFGRPSLMGSGRVTISTVDSQSSPLSIPNHPHCQFPNHLHCRFPTVSTVDSEPSMKPHQPFIQVIDSVTLFNVINGYDLSCIGVTERLVGGWCVYVVCCKVLDSAVCVGREGAGRGKDIVGIF